MTELLDIRPDANVQESEFRRLLGYPAHHSPGERARELAAWARHWYTLHGRPWVYLRESEVEIDADSLRIQGTTFHSKALRDLLRRAEVRRVMLAIVSAGANCEEHSRQLWQEGKPDEYFFLEMFGSAVVEHLVATTSGRVCALAESNGMAVLPHYSPGYTGWDVADQPRLFELICARSTCAFPEELQVLTSGMLKPKKSLLGVFGITAQGAGTIDPANLIPCENCSFGPCQFRRAPYRHASSRGAQRSLAREAAPTGAGLAGAAVDSNVRYSVNARALEKWSRERLQLKRGADDTVEARFRYEGTTCSNLGRPLAFEYSVTLGPRDEHYTILRADCQPAADDTGHTHMCAYLSNRTALLSAIASEKPLLGKPLAEVLNWTRAASPAGCYCDAESRMHKWGLVFEVIHYALAHGSAHSAARPDRGAVSESN